MIWSAMGTRHWAEDPDAQYLSTVSDGTLPRDGTYKAKSTHYIKD